MSSTNRGSDRREHEADYYVAPKEPIRQVLEWMDGNWCLKGNLPKEFRRVLDPAAGGNPETITMKDWGMPYPEVLEEFGISGVDTMDVRKDSKASAKGVDFTKTDFKDSPEYDLVITNPPFNLAEDFIRKGWGVLKYGGVMIMLLRLNFLGGLKRKPLFDEMMPQWIFVHRKRICFTENMKYLKRQTDSIEYAHFLWHKMDVSKNQPAQLIIL